MSSGPVLQVAINAPLSRLFDYLPPAGSLPAPGCRVLVPFGRQKQVGLVMGIADHSDVPATKLKSIAAIIDAQPILDDVDRWLIRFTSDYYHHPIGEVVAAALPALLRQGKSLFAINRRLTVSELGRNTDLNVISKRAPRQAALLAAIRDADDIGFAELDELLPEWRRSKKSLIDKQLIEEYESTDDDESSGALANAEQKDGPTLNPDQEEALRAIRERQGFNVSLLDGVTGSGKTEVYLRLIREHLDAGRQVLVLVPEIGLTPQLVDRFRTRLGLEPVVLHSGLTDLARLTAWRAARRGTAQLFLGTRSAVFVPLKDLGMIVVDEEHDASLKQQEGLRYSARDLAVVRGKKQDIPVVLGTATPSLESLQRCRDGAYQHLVLPQRAGEAVPPRLRLVDLSREQPGDGLSAPVVTAIENCVADNGQVLVFLNRRGFAPTLICSGCGKIADCNRCDARMTVHLRMNRLLCHHCGAARAIDASCDECGNAVRPLGQGTERLEDALRARFPQQTITRIDSDSTRARGAMEKALESATRGDSNILVGTQMLSKGHHFPNLMLVVVINADQGLFSTDFRGSERLAQSLIQVAGRAGRESRQGEVIIQTLYPKHAFWSELFDGGYERVASAALAEREQAAWPPFSRVALVRAAAAQRDETHRFLEMAKGIAVELQLSEVRILGPVSAPMERRAGRYRAQLLLQCRQRNSLHQMLGQLRAALEGSPAARRVRWSIDVDPIELF